MNQRFWPLTCLFASAMLGMLSGDASALTRHKHDQHAKKAHETGRDRHHRGSAHAKSGHSAHVAERHKSEAPPPVENATASPLSGNLASVKNAIDLVRHGKPGEATSIEKMLADPAARKLVEWFILR